MAPVEITLSDKAKTYLDAVVGDGDYPDASAFIDALVLADSARFDELRDEIRKGRESGISPHSGPEIVRLAIEKHRRQCA